MPASKAEVVFLVHGLGRNKNALRTIAADLEQNARFEVVRLEYPSRSGNFEYQLASLERQIAPYLANAQYRSYHFVGHSLGGVLSWVLWQQTPTESQGRLIFIGSPLQGSSWLEDGLIRREILEPFYGSIFPDLYDIPALMEKHGVDENDPSNKMKIAGDVCPWYVNMMGLTHSVNGPHDCFVTTQSAWAFAAERRELCPLTHEGLLHEPCSLEHIRYWLESFETPSLLSQNDDL